MARNLFQISHAEKAYTSKVLFDDATFAVNEGEHIGVIGPNGAGKSTLFKVLLNEESLDAGNVILSTGLRIKILRQEDTVQGDPTVYSYLDENCTSPIWEVQQIAEKFEITEDMYEAPLLSLSGGFQMRIKLIALLGSDPDLLLLDEPTNYLDLDTLLLLENFLQTYKGTFMVISHDREFLRKVTDHIVEVELGNVTKFNGNIDDYFEQKELLTSILMKEAKNAEAKKKRIQDFVDKFRAKATKARQAQSKLKLLDKIEVIEVPTISRQAAINIPPPHRTGKDILEVTAANMGYGKKVILEDVNFNLKRGDHLGIVGQNGAGKSTFLKSMASEIPLVDGELKLGHKVELGYYAQHVSQKLVPDHTVLQSLTSVAEPSISEFEIKTLAGSLLFSGEDILKPIRVLSGGEKSRVALGQILLQKRPCLLLDEPTNHLDFETVEALAEALKSYDGTVVVVSHDRTFIKRVTTKILEIRDGQAILYPGTYDEYVWSLQKGSLSKDDTPTQKKKPSSQGKVRSSRNSKTNYKNEKKKLQSAIRDLENKIKGIERRQVEIESSLHSLNEKLLKAQGNESRDLMKELSAHKAESESIEKEYFSCIESLEEMKTNLKELTN